MNFLVTSNYDAYGKCNGVKTSIFLRKSSKAKVKVYRNRNNKVQISKTATQV